MEEEICYQIALTMVPNLGPVHIYQLANHFGSAKAIFETDEEALLKMEGLGVVTVKAIQDFDRWQEVDNEINFIEQENIKVLFLTHPDYPKRLLNCYDPPSVLYYKGTANLNAKKIISIIGTRRNSIYGQKTTETFVQDLKGTDIVIVSGLAMGIDSIAHQQALNMQLDTIGVLAHGLDCMYPSCHRSLANKMIGQGGLLTEFGKLTQPEKYNFPRRNRIVAGLSDATLVIESTYKGGSMITAAIAESYHKDLFAIPGKTTDPKSSGCLQLIYQNKAQLITSAEQLLLAMGWLEQRTPSIKQRKFFTEISTIEKNILDLFPQDEPISFEEIYFHSGLSHSQTSAALLNLELNAMISALPGKLYMLL